jgi:hypothetical protein
MRVIISAANGGLQFGRFDNVPLRLPNDITGVFPGTESWLTGLVGAIAAECRASEDVWEGVRALMGNANRDEVDRAWSMIWDNLADSGKALVIAAVMVLSSGGNPLSATTIDAKGKIEIKVAQAPLPADLEEAVKVQLQKMRYGTGNALPLEIFSPAGQRFIKTTSQMGEALRIAGPLTTTLCTQIESSDWVNQPAPAQVLKLSAVASTSECAALIGGLAV